MSVLLLVLSLFHFLSGSTSKIIPPTERRAIIMGWDPALYFPLILIDYISIVVGEELSMACTPFMLLVCEKLSGGRCNLFCTLLSSISLKSKLLTGDTTTKIRWFCCGISNWYQLLDLASLFINFKLQNNQEVIRSRANSFVGVS